MWERILRHALLLWPLIRELYPGDAETPKWGMDAIWVTLTPS